MRPSISYVSTSRPSHPLAAAVIGLVLVAASPLTLAQYKWKDANGQAHASDLPPPRDIPDKNILLRPARATGSAAARAQTATPASGNLPSPGVSEPNSAAGVASARNPVDPELEARRKRSEADARTRARADEDRAGAVRAENCQRARQQLALVNSGQRMQRLNDSGERVVVDDAGRADEAQLAQRVIASDCR